MSDPGDRTGDGAGLASGPVAWIPRSWGWIGLGFALALLGGCRPAATERAAALVASTPNRGYPDRPDFGVGPHATFIALGDTTSTLSAEPSPFRFADIRESSGVDFVHASGNDGRKLFPTGFGSGVAMLDYDGDGRLDLYFATGNLLPPGDGPRKGNRLYRNLGEGRFVDATEAAGLGFSGFCHGIVAGDIDNDGDVDVFLCNFGPNVLLRNDGGVFRDVSHEAGVDRPGIWSSGGALLDYDADGDLDLYVANYGDWAYPRDAHRCGSDRVPLFCSPHEVKPARHILYRNNGDGTFADVTEAAGLGRADGRGFGAVAADLNGDGRVDLYVANDLCPNFLYLNRGDGTFADATGSSGAAFDEAGAVQASMGCDAEDCDGDGRPELLTTNFQNEHIGFYRNLCDPPAPSRTPSEPTATFQEASASAGLAVPSRPWVGWGCALADFDADGWPDCFVANGHIDTNRKDLAPTMTYDEPPLLFLNQGARAAGAKFRLSTRDVGPYFTSRHVARGVAVGDLDDDGDLDLAVNHMDGPPALLRNDTPRRGDWIRLRLVGTRSPRDAIGARVEVEAGGRTLVRQVKGGGSVQSSHDPRLLIGLGPVGASGIGRVTVRWPSGIVTRLDRPAANQNYVVVEPTAGEGVGTRLAPTE